MKMDPILLMDVDVLKLNLILLFMCRFTQLTFTYLILVGDVFLSTIHEDGLLSLILTLKNPFT